MFNVDFMLGLRLRQLTYNNQTLPILQHKQDRSTPACVVSDGPTLNQYWVSVSYWLRLHTSKNDDPALGSCNPQSEMLSQH